MRQGDLFEFTRQTADVPAIPDESPEERFRRFHEANPHVYAAVVHFARVMRGKGAVRGSIWLIFNRLRWEYAIQTRGDAFRLNNNLTPFYSRLVMEREADLDGFFETRERKSA